MDEVGGALIAIALVLCAVFIPAALIGGIQGQFFRQFAVTIAAATVISAFVSLTLSPALCAHPAEAARRSTTAGRAPLLLRPVRRLLPRLQPRLRPAVVRLRRADAPACCASAAVVLVVYVGLIGADRLAVRAARRPASSREQDQGYLITVIQLPPGASLARTDAVVKQATKLILDDRRASSMPCPSPASTARPSPTPRMPAPSSRAFAPFDEREAKGLTADAHLRPS